MKFNLELDCDNAAFQPDPLLEILRLLEDVRDRMVHGSSGGPLQDINGNTVGAFWLKGEDPE